MVYGLLLGAVIIFGVECTAEFDPPLAVNVLTDDVKAEMKKWTDVAVQEKWRNLETRLKIRDCCPIGSKYKYKGDQLDYFYPIRNTRTEVLERILKRNET